MRALLLYNPEATRMSPGTRDVIARALAAETKLETAETKRRGHAWHLAAGAAHEGFDLVVCLSGDGTLNEVINGLAGTGVPIAPLPGGGTNVFARTLGLPRDPIEATAVLLDRLRDGLPARRVNLGVVNGRRFSFCAGVGFDAAVVRAVERRLKLRKRLGDWLFVSTAVRLFFFGWDRRHPALTLEHAGKRTRDLHYAIVCNTNPYTFLGKRPFQVCPSADLERGLDVTALATMRTFTTVRVVLRAFGSGGHVRLTKVRTLADADAFTLEASRPVPLQLDGDFVGEGTRFAFGLERNALSVLP